MKTTILFLSMSVLSHLLNPSASLEPTAETFRRLHEKICWYEEKEVCLKTEITLITDKTESLFEKIEERSALAYRESDSRSHLDPLPLSQPGFSSLYRPGQPSVLSQHAALIEIEQMELQIRKLAAFRQQLYVQLDTCESNRQKLEAIQAELAGQVSFPHFQEGGSYNPQALINNPQTSLSYGGPASQNRQQVGFDTACFAYGDGSLSASSAGWIHPIPQGYVSAGTWAYPGGGMHLGLDIAAPMHTPIYAPANGLIVYADNPVSENCGYLGNWCGWPLGGGNTIAMIAAVNGQLYGVTFCHTSGIYSISAGQQVEQGMLIALSGNSGNSSGPHTHIEVFELHCSFEQALAIFRSGADFSFGTGWNTPAACTAYACRIRPESIFG